MFGFLQDLKCSHDYEIINQFEMDSEFDSVRKAGYKPNSYHSLKRKHVTDFKCSLCGKSKRLTEVTE